MLSILHSCLSKDVKYPSCKWYKGRHEVESRWYVKKQIHKEWVENNLYYLHTMVHKVSKPGDIGNFCLFRKCPIEIFVSELCFNYMLVALFWNSKIWVSQHERLFLWLQSWHCIHLVFLPLFFSWTVLFCMFCHCCRKT